MATFWLSFRIAYETVGGKTYETRYNDFTNTLAGLRTKYWEETSSFMIFESAFSIDQIATKAKAAFAPSTDIFVIRDLNRQTARACGNIKDQDLFVLAPYAKKV
ncbi:hypothetical protein [Lysobacter antibioticus]|uniref:hypothetical protein n=1 Tax=Lysobacter antibioticus TaxID=84531 RepID=UPI0004D01876|nr:hypothetical protein [Lysobacter antibioticus]